MAEVILDKVRKVFPGNVVAVAETSLKIEDQEFVVLVGPSGCGKTTTLRMIAGLEEITDGTISIGDKVVNDIPPKDRDIAMVFQNYALYPHKTVFQNMAFALQLRRFPKAEIKQRVHEAAKILGIEELMERRPSALSGGQRQRVAVGRAIVRQPKVFLFDEPLSNLDAKMRVEMRAELKRLHQRLKTTMVYVTHDQVEAMTLGDRVVIMEGGYIKQVGTPLEVYDFPENKFVAGFIGTPPMNFFSGNLQSQQGSLYFRKGSSMLIKLPDHYKQAMESKGPDAAVILGVRPENVLEPEKRPDLAKDTTFKARIDVIEPLGAEMILYLTAENSIFLARVDAHCRAQVGEVLSFAMHPDHMHVFDPNNGKNLTVAAAQKYLRG
ncbi:MAG TPA: sn-glycerol-3-phosphate ABC transporter ATP-binding protein UgpC [Candidatus Brocadiia bacterium]|nr:sn-glycerol-3-phosphate ABC transporter ATP-binding protein UgpC [Candidatus Brocadiia bacterium]